MAWRCRLLECCPQVCLEDPPLARKCCCWQRHKLHTAHAVWYTGLLHGADQGKSPNMVLQHRQLLQVGWVTGPQRLVGAVAKAHMFLVFTVPSNLQQAVAHGLEHEQGFFK